MITNWGEKIAHRLAASGTILPEEIGLYSYGFFLLLSSTLYLIIAAIFGSAFGVLWESIVFYLLFSIIREYAGGIHAKTEYGCMLSTILVLLLSAIGIQKMTQFKLSTAAIVFLIVGCTVVFIFSPLAVPKRPLSADDWWNYRRTSRWLSVVYALLGVWASATGWPILYPTATAATLEGILLFVGTMNKNAE